MRAKFIIVCLTLASASAGAIDWNQQTGGYIGGQFGLTVPSESNTSSRTGYGAVAGGKLGDNFGLGAYFLGSSKTENAQNIGSFKYNFFGLEANYFFDGSGRGGYVGANVGLSKITETDRSGNSYNFSPFVWGIQAGYDYMLTEFLSLGGEANVMFVSSQNATTNGVTVNLSSFTSINFLVQAKLWF
jgi:hypothetical protein